MLEYGKQIRSEIIEYYLGDGILKRFTLSNSKAYSEYSREYERTSNRRGDTENRSDQNGSRSTVGDKNTDREVQKSARSLSEEDIIRVYEAEIKRLHKFINQLKQKAVGGEFSYESLKKVSRKVQKIFKSTYSFDEISEKIKPIYEYILNGEELNGETLSDMINSVVDDILAHDRGDNPIGKRNEELAEDLHKRKIYISEKNS